MASTVAKACSSTSSQMTVMKVQEKGSRNKRKFRADPPLLEPSKPIPLPMSDCTSFEFSAEKFNTDGHANSCGLCCLSQDTPDSLKLNLGLSCLMGLSEPAHQSDKADTLEEGFHSADWSDLTETELEELVLSNLDTIFKSALKRIVASGYSEGVATTAILRSGIWYGCKDTVSNVVDNTLAFLSSEQEIDSSREHYLEDLQQMEKYILSVLVCLLREVRPFFSTGDAMWCLLICDMNLSHACAMDNDPFGSFLGVMPTNPSSLNAAQSQSGTEAKNPKPNNGLNKHNPNPDSNEKPFNAMGISRKEEKFIGKLSGITKGEYILGQKSMHYRTYGSSKGTSSMANKLSTLGSLVLDKKLKGVANPTGLHAKHTPLGTVPQENKGHIPSMPLADTELSLSFPAKGISYSMEDEMMMNLVPRARELQNQLQEWTEWANQKVMQAARRLGKDKSELKALRQEKEEVERVKQTLEENTMKKLSEMENALCKESRRVERANAAVRRLGVENVALRQEMEAARQRAAESAASCRDVSRREKKTLVKFQSWEKQKSALQEDLAAERSRLAWVRERLLQAKDIQHQMTKLRPNLTRNRRPKMSC